MRAAHPQRRTMRQKTRRAASAIDSADRGEVRHAPQMALTTKNLAGRMRVHVVIPAPVDAYVEVGVRSVDGADDLPVVQLDV